MDKNVTPIAVTIHPSEKTDNFQEPSDFFRKTPYNSYDKMSQRIKEFEKDCKHWRDRFFHESKLGKPSSLLMNERPQLFLEGSNFPEFPSDWNATSLSRTSAKPPYQNVLEEDMNGNKILKIYVDVGDFSAEELKVSVSGSTLVIKGEREIIRGNTSRTENINKELTIPDYVDQSRITSYLSNSGQLIIESPVTEPRLISGNLEGFQSSPFASHTKSRTQSHSNYNSQLSSVARSQKTGSGDSELTRRNNFPGNYSIESPNPRSQSVIIQNLPTPWPSTNVQETFDKNENTLCYKFDLSGFNSQEIFIEVQNETVIITAQHDELDNTGKTYRKYQKEIKLPNDVDSSSMKKELNEQGILTLKMQMLSKYKQSAEPLHTNIKSTNIYPHRQDESSVHVIKDSQKLQAEHNNMKLNYDMALYKTDSIDVKVMGNVLIISAARLDKSQNSDFHQKFNLPDWADGKLTRAVIKDNILKIEIPRKGIN